MFVKKISLDICLLLFVFSAFSLLWLPDFLLLSSYWAVIIAALFLLLFLFFRLKPAYHGKKVQSYFIYAFVTVCSLAYVHAYALTLSQQADQIAHLPKQLEAEIKVVEVLQQQHYQTFIATTNLQPHLPQQRVYIQWKRDEKVKRGEVWRATLRLRPLSSRLNFAGFDRQQWYFSKGITAWASVKSAVKIGEDFSWRDHWLMNTFKQTETFSTQGLLLALAFGERAWLPTAQWQIYQQTNTAHLIAISGLHIGLAMALGFYLGRGIQFFLPSVYITPTLPIYVGLALAFIYAMLAGFAIPTQRAFFALLWVFALRLSRFYYTPWQLLLRGVALLLVYDPLMCLSGSFWLSLGAVCALMIWYQYFPLHLLCWREGTLPQQMGIVGRWLISLLHLQIGLLLLFMPIQLLMFGGISWSGMMANLIVVPLFSFLVVPVILFTLLTQNLFSTWTLAHVFVDSITQGLSYFTGQWLTVSTSQAFGIFFLLIGLFGVAIYYCYPQSPTSSPPSDLLSIWRKGLSLNPEIRLSPSHKKGIIGSCVCASLGMVMYGIVYLLNKPTWQLDTLDVGQGLAMLIVKNDRAILYDTGASWQGGSMAALEILPYLQRQGIPVDKLILSHDDNDHAGGAKTLLQHFPQTELVTPSFQNYGKTDRTFCTQGQEWHWQGLHFQVLSPKNRVKRAKNADSCVILISDGVHQVLLTGDADVGVERHILPMLPAIDVLQVGHHGSKTSTSQAFVHKIQPKIALISSGRWNAWGFPHQVVMTRLSQASSQIYNTAHAGQIRIQFEQNQINVQTARTEFSPWYRRLIGLKTK
ncbi:DNA internalization-related competence protein ComEC/Rec2 [Pasteurella sp. PK-2025]|uniref:DNA internalization-related competence protein ComEC/Rec2 n=1 Tax=Pasteurella sp. PK-2025 TaxID=3413133 RepID=UPI003C78A477